MRNILVLIMVVSSAAVTVSAQAYDASYIRKRGVVQVGPPTTYLKEGLRTEEVFRLLGQPLSKSERAEQDFVVTTYEFARGERRVLVAEFVNDSLIRSRIETREKIVWSDGRNF